MAHKPLAAVVRYLRRISAVPDVDAITDAQLLERFVNRHEQAAFDVLVWRHGTIVWSVCRRLLPDVPAAEDAFQATFLTLVRKAGSISKPEAVGSWLYKVAYRIALRAQAQATTRAVHEKLLAELPDVAAVGDVPEEAAWQEIRTVLDEEIQRLPDKYRTPVILCYLEGKAYEEAAQQLGWPKGTVSTRLTRARELLRTRLARRGIVLSATALTTVLSSHAGLAAVPATLVDVTARVAAQVASGQPAVAGAVPASVATLVDGVLRAMWVTKLKMVAAVMLAIGILTAGAGLLTRQALADKQSSVAPESQPRFLVQAKDKPEDDRALLQGSWKVVALERGGKPALGHLEKETRWVFIQDKVSLHSNRIERTRGTYQLDLAKNPRRIDLTLTEMTLGQEETFTYFGIYRLEGDTLKICVAPHEAQRVQRPAEFDTRTKPELGLWLLVLTREPVLGAKSVLDARHKRQLRWSLHFDTRDSNDYLKQLQALGAILAVPQEEGQFLVLRDLTRRPAGGQKEDLSQMPHIYWIENKPESVQGLASALGLASPPRFFVAFFPERVEQELLRLELTHAGRKEEEIVETRFEVVKKGDGYEFKAVAQTTR